MVLMTRVVGVVGDLLLPRLLRFLLAFIWWCLGCLKAVANEFPLVSSAPSSSVIVCNTFF